MGVIDRVQMLNELDRRLRWRTVDPEPKKDRDRSLHGKARVRARKAKQRAAKLEEFAE